MRRKLFSVATQAEAAQYITIVWAVIHEELPPLRPLIERLMADIAQ
jgi:uncharacterized protein with HEPN domain